MMFRIGIISDTHGLLRPEAKRGMTGVDHIIHAGDIGRPEIVDALRRIAPVTAIRGNVDSGEWAREYPDTDLVRLAGKSIYILHDVKTLQAATGAGIDVIVSGHSHVPRIDMVGGVLYLNPGSAGPRRCQSACKFDPSSASNFDPFVRRVLLVALVSSELAGIAEARRARVA
ncbi:putative phosphoesterase [Bradyrhizobium elkanii]|nr:putative phosphoesterase [Bradyrhizobium elkanii]